MDGVAVGKNAWCLLFLAVPSSFDAAIIKFPGWPTPARSLRQTELAHELGVAGVVHLDLFGERVGAAYRDIGARLGDTVANLRVLHDAGRRGLEFVTNGLRR